MAKLTRPDGMQWAILLLLCCYGLNFIQANTDETVYRYLERGQRGIVPCPLVQSRKISPSDVDAMYWYYGSPSRTSLLISYFNEIVAPQNGIPEGVSDIDNEFSLVIENVTALDEKTYYLRVKPRGRMTKEGQVEVRDKVSPKRPHPTVIGCNQDHDADTCEVRVPHGSRVYNLTCIMEQVKPAVDLRWIHLFLGGKTVLNASTTVLPANTDSWLRNNTYSTSASIQVEAVDDEVYECEAVGVAVGGSSVRTRVRLTPIYSTTATDGEETTLVLSDEASSTAFELAAWHIFLILMAVLIILSLIVCPYHLYLTRRRCRARETLETSTYTSVATSSSSDHKTESN